MSTRVSTANFHFPPDSLPDGVYWVQHNIDAGGFTVAGGKIIRIAPAISKRLEYYLHFARRIGDA